ncbi:MAG: DEAD/DEAH box helicase [Verrucomicrobiales bacterium]|nr:DEAD/DEAH box helicase [Verrucomicrobiales bacterium]
MKHTHLIPYVEDAIDGLKDFQSASVDALHDRLYVENRPCMLLADEVGLGKTVVAKGLIAKVLKERIDRGEKKPFKVTYICSNQVIAKENLRKLNLFPASFSMKPPISRISYLAWAPNERAGKEERQTLLEMNTLTPATSFKVTDGMGNMWERRIVFAALCHDPFFLDQKNGLSWMLKWTVRRMDRYKEELNKSLQWEMRGGLPERFLRLLKRTKIPKHVDAVYGELEGRGSVTLYEAVAAFAEKVDGRTWKGYWDGSNYLASRLRECLIDCCLRYVDADLYILDEFQRFRDLIDEESEEDHARLARKIFFEQSPDTRILLLSATPFKAFTGYDDVERGEDHYQDFRKVLSFLLRNDEVALLKYERHRQALYRQILDLRSGDVAALSGEHREEVERVLRSAMCRTERHSVAADPNALINDLWKDPAHIIPFDAGDIENFKRTDSLARALRTVGYHAGKPVEYCKSALFPLSFLDRYKFKEQLRLHRDNPKVREALRQSKEGWLDLENIDSYKWALSSPEKKTRASGNARLAKLIEQAVGPHGAKLLWVPPSLPYYELEDAYAGSEGFTKTLLFSSWVMVPRMVSTMVSYEVERQTVGNPETVDQQEVEERSYFAKKRHPVPLIRYARRSREGRTQLVNMSNFTLLFPSQILAEIAAPIQNIKHGRSLGELRAQAKEDIERRIEEAGLARFITPGGEGERWYWAAPLLLDRADSEARKSLEQWFEWGQSEAGDEALEEEEKDSDEFKGAKKDHYDFLKACFEDPSLIGLGQPPDDLAEVLADLALGSPAIIAIRSLRRLFGKEADPSSMLTQATRIADEFASLFNKPESIAAVRLSEKHEWYWRMVADYCASGCLQSVLDEYFHLLYGQNVNPQGAVDQLLGAINLNASSINVDSLDTFLSGQPKKMRCHYAAEFGSQRIETDQGQKRASGLREVFNSPFRPFLLSTTSIGQEGLDFHSYCRRIVHWNLPGNPVDLEQREGRINRFKSLVIRQQVARTYGPKLDQCNFDRGSDIWEELFRLADQEEREKTGKCELIPFWHVETDADIRIERVIPLYPFSLDRGRLDHILKTLAIYRLAFGQPRQAELVDHLLERKLSQEEIQHVMDTLMINLSPIRYGEGKRGVGELPRMEGNQ